MTEETSVKTYAPRNVGIDLDGRNAIIRAAIRNNQAKLHKNKDILSDWGKRVADANNSKPISREDVKPNPDMRNLDDVLTEFEGKKPKAGERLDALIDATYGEGASKSIPTYKTEGNDIDNPFYDSTSRIPKNPFDNDLQNKLWDMSYNKYKDDYNRKMLGPTESKNSGGDITMQESPFKPKKAVRERIVSKTPDDKYMRIGDYYGSLAGDAMTNRMNNDIREYNNKIDADIAAYNSGQEDTKLGILKDSADVQNKMLELKLKNMENRNMDVVDPLNLDSTGLNLKNQEDINQLNALDSEIKDIEKKINVYDASDPNQRAVVNQLKQKRDNAFYKYNVLKALAEQQGFANDNQTSNVDYVMPKAWTEERWKALNEGLPSLINGKNFAPFYKTNGLGFGEPNDSADLIQAEGAKGTFRGMSNPRLHTPKEAAVFAKQHPKYSNEWMRDQGGMVSVNASKTPYVLYLDSPTGPKRYIEYVGDDGNKTLLNLDALQNSKEGLELLKKAGLNSSIEALSNQ